MGTGRCVRVVGVFRTLVEEVMKVNDGRFVPEKRNGVGRRLEAAHIVRGFKVEPALVICAADRVKGNSVPAPGYRTVNVTGKNMRHVFEAAEKCAEFIGVFPLHSINVEMRQRDAERRMMQKQIDRPVAALLQPRFQPSPARSTIGARMQSSVGRIHQDERPGWRIANTLQEAVLIDRCRRKCMQQLGSVVVVAHQEAVRNLQLGKAAPEMLIGDGIAVVRQVAGENALSDASA